MPFKIPAKNAVIVNAIKALSLAPEIKYNNSRILAIRISRDMNYSFIGNKYSIEFETLKTGITHFFLRHDLQIHFEVRPQLFQKMYPTFESDSAS